jgi:hypothetical protein
MTPSETAVTENVVTAAGSKRYDAVAVHSMVTDNAVLQGVPHAVVARAQQRGDTGTEPVCLTSTRSARTEHVYVLHSFTSIACRCHNC